MDLPALPPRSTVPKILGIVAIILGSLGLVCSCTGAFGPLALPVASKMMKSAQQQIEQQRAAEEADFARQMEEAQTDEERGRIERERDRWRAQQPPFDLGTMYDWAEDPRYYVHALADAGLGLITNLLMLVAGIGLVRYARWGRRLALGTAAVKIVVNIVSALWSAFVVAPLVGAGMERMFEQMEQFQRTQPGPQPPSFGPMMKMQRITGAVGAVFGGLAACAFPIVLLILLNLRKVRQAFESPPPASPSP
jgi:hypothetical protein